MKQKETHTCKAPNCNRQIPKRYLMCRSHWFEVPQPIRDRVWHEWAEVQTTGQITIAYARAVRDAIESIGKRPPPLDNPPSGANPVQSFDDNIPR